MPLLGRFRKQDTRAIRVASLALTSQRKLTLQVPILGKRSGSRAIDRSTRRIKSKSIEWHAIISQYLRPPEHRTQNEHTSNGQHGAQRAAGATTREE
jgi:hypothetical protein